jgi:hypothetical protein
MLLDVRISFDLPCTLHAGRGERPGVQPVIELDVTGGDQWRQQHLFLFGGWAIIGFEELPSSQQFDIKGIH